MNNNINFHQTFPPTPEFLMRILEISDGEEALTKEEISELTGIPTGKSSGKVEPHICYAEYMGLITDDRSEGKHRLFKTALGQELLMQDPGLQEKVSLAVCHARLTSKYDGAFLWSIMFKSIMSKYPKGISEAILNDEIEKNIGTQVRMGPFFSSYTGMFSSLNLINKDASTITLNKLSASNELIYVYAYALIYEWEQCFGEQNEITASELDALKIADTFALSGNVFYEVLERMAEKNIIRFNRQLAPYTIIRLHSAQDLIPMLFNELC